jgi:hypothetical protein
MSAAACTLCYLLHTRVLLLLLLVLLLFQFHGIRQVTNMKPLLLLLLPMLLPLLPLLLLLPLQVLLVPSTSSLTMQGPTSSLLTCEEQQFDCCLTKV